MKQFAMMLILLSLLPPAAAWAEPAVSPSPAAVVRSVPPQASGPIPDLRLPAIREFALDNGLPVYTVTQPMALVERVSIVFPSAGAKNEPVGKYGLSSLISNYLTSGASKREGKGSSALLSLGAALGANSSWDSAVISCKIRRTERLPEVMDLFAPAVLRPEFSPKEFDAIKNALTARMSRLRSNDRWLAETAFSRFIYGEKSRYAVPLQVIFPEQLVSFTCADAEEYYKRHYTPERAFFVCYGSADPEYLVKLLNERFGRWQSGGCVQARAEAAAGNAAVPAPRSEPHYIPSGASAAGSPMEGRLLLVNLPEAKQSRILVGCAGVSAQDPDILAIQAMNTVLGSCSVIDHLNANLREEKQYTYGVSSELDTRLDSGAFEISTRVQTDKTVPAVQEILKEIALMRRPLPEAELQRFLQYMAYSLPSQFDSDDNFSGFIEKMLLGLYSRDYADTYVSKVLRLTPEDIRKAAQRVLDPDKMKVVIVGDAKALEPQLKEVGWRAQVLTPEDVMEPE